MIPLLVATAIFVLTYAVIAAEKAHKTVVALLGAMVLLLLGILNETEAFAAIDLNVIFLLVGTMILANVIRHTGIFQWLAIRSVKMARGDPYLILVLLSAVTAIISAFLPNVTTVILIVPVTLFVTESLHLDPIPFLVSEILASNIGGTMTLIGDPPNIIIGSAANLSFVDFLTNTAPIAVLILLVYLGAARWFLRHSFVVDKKAAELVMNLDETTVITNTPLLRKSLIVLGLTVLGFLFHQQLGVLPSTVALGGAAVLLLWTGFPVHEAFEQVEWTTIFFFVGLFILVAGVAQVGALDLVAKGAAAVTAGNGSLAAVLILWLSAFLSSLIDNVPYTAAMVPVVRELGQTIPIMPLWWSLALGACLGGNATVVGASANVAVAQIAERGGQPISFGRYLGYGVPVTIMSMVLCTAYIWIRYLI
jgi:Na+/H+ antiporter NhaD/arsenite permease-like protein